MRRRVKACHANGITKAEKLAYLAMVISGCRQCETIARKRILTVPGEGNVDADVLLVGEAPGDEEDRVGRPFAGQDGTLLFSWLAALGITREDVFTVNVLKCRPDASSGRRIPTTNEVLACLPYLLAQIDIVRPKVIVAFGSTAADALLKDSKRGHIYQLDAAQVLTTYHPAHVMRDGTERVKGLFWAHLLTILDLLGRPVSNALINGMPTA